MDFILIKLVCRKYPEGIELKVAPSFRFAEDEKCPLCRKERASFIAMEI